MDVLRDGALVSAYFRGLSKQLDRKKGTLQSIGQKLAVLRAAPHARCQLDKCWRSSRDNNGHSSTGNVDPSEYEEHEIIKRELEALDTQLVIVLDDVDRLRPDEVRDIVRLVRLFGDFPNTIYMLAFDRKRVEQCLGEDDGIERGCAYLEKTSRSCTTCRWRVSTT